MPHPDRATRPSPHGHPLAIKPGYRRADRPGMFFVVWGWSRRAIQQGVVGPFTCARCQWSGTFWLLAVERRFRLYWIPLGGWKVRSHGVVCRNCGHAVDVARDAAPALVDSAQPVLVADPFGPEPVAASAAVRPPVG